MIHEYLKVAFESGDSELLMTALGNVDKVKGMSEIARDTGLSLQNLYKALQPGGSPQYETIKKVVEGLGCHISLIRATSGTYFDICNQFKRSRVSGAACCAPMSMIALIRKCRPYAAMTDSRCVTTCSLGTS